MSIFGLLTSYDEAWKGIILPRRQDYDIKELGPNEIMVNNCKILRKDLKIKNNRGMILECSFFQNIFYDPTLPCVIYLHGNGCSRIESLNYRDYVLENKMNFFTFDFSSSGKSDGMYSSIGWHEKGDIETVVKYLKSKYSVSKIALWGRSMGAASAIFYLNKHSGVDCAILDSSYSNFRQLVNEYVESKAPVPSLITAGIFQLIRSTIQKKAEFDIEEINPINFIKSIKIPLLFGAGKFDNLISINHTKDLFSACNSKKDLMIFESDHNSVRPNDWMTNAFKFLKVHLRLPATDSKFLNIIQTNRSLNEQNFAEILNVRRVHSPLKSREIVHEKSPERFLQNMSHYFSYNPEYKIGNISRYDQIISDNTFTNISNFNSEKRTERTIHSPSKKSDDSPRKYEYHSIDKYKSKAEPSLVTTSLTPKKIQNIINAKYSKIEDNKDQLIKNSSKYDNYISDSKQGKNENPSSKTINTLSVKSRQISQEKNVKSVNNIPVFNVSIDKNGERKDLRNTFLNQVKYSAYLEKKV